MPLRSSACKDILEALGIPADQCTRAVIELVPDRPMMVTADYFVLELDAYDGAGKIVRRRWQECVEPAGEEEGAGDPEREPCE